MKRKRHAAILELVRSRRVGSQDELRRLLERRGHRVTQATLSRDLRELRIIKIPDPKGVPYYASTAELEGSDREAPALDRLVPELMIEAEGVGNLIVVRTLVGGAQAVAEALDLADWEEVLGTVAGDDTILIVLRKAKDRSAVIDRLEALRVEGPM